MGYAHHDLRRPTREVAIGDLVVGGQHPIAVQSMTNTEHVGRRGNGCADPELVRRPAAKSCASRSPKRRDLRALPAIQGTHSTCRWCADIHFDYRMALGCLDAVTAQGRPACDKIRINPGNIGGHERFCEVVRKARQRGIPMRIGVNSGSLEKDLLAKHGFPTARRPWSKARSATSRPRSDSATTQIVVSIKSSHVPTAVESYRLFAERCDYPTHLGITEAGPPPYGAIKSAVGTGGSAAARDRRHDPRLAAHPPQSRRDRHRRSTFSRRPGGAIAEAGGDRLPHLRPPGNRSATDRGRSRGPPQARAAPAAARSRSSAASSMVWEKLGRPTWASQPVEAKGVIFRRGTIVRHVQEHEMVDALLEEARLLAAESVCAVGKRRR